MKKSKSTKIGYDKVAKTPKSAKINQNLSAPTEVSCGTVIINDGKVLLVQAISHEGDLIWGFPKGHQEKGETKIETALRETKEEVGLDVAITSDKPFEVSYLIRYNSVQKYVYFFLAKPKNPQQAPVPQPGEIEQIKWVDFKEADRLLTQHYADTWANFMDKII